MADDNGELARLLAGAEQPVGPAERELAARNRKLRAQAGQPGDDLARTLAGPGGIGSDGRMPVGPAADDLTRTLAGTGGGIGSDARMPIAPVQRDPQLERKIQVWTMSGRQPTPEMDAYLRAIAPEKMDRSERLAGRDTPLVPYLPAELSMIPQMGRAGNAIGKAYEDPSIPNVTNAGVQTSIAALRPLAGLKMLGAGYSAAVADDLGAFDSMSAEAQTKKARRHRDLCPGCCRLSRPNSTRLRRRLVWASSEVPPTGAWQSSGTGSCVPYPTGSARKRTQGLKPSTLAAAKLPRPPSSGRWHAISGSKIRLWARCSRRPLASPRSWLRQERAP